MHVCVRTTDDQIYSATKINKQVKTRRSGLGMDMQNVRAKIQVQNRSKSGVCYVVARNYLVLEQDRVFALCPTEYLNQAGQIFECLRETFYRQTCLGVPAVASFRKKGGEMSFLRKRLTMLGSFYGLRSVGQHFDHQRQSQALKKKCSCHPLPVFVEVNMTPDM